VSFVVIGLDEAEHLAASIASLAEQGLSREAIEILYVDSGSRDGSPDVARRAGVDEVLAIDGATASAARARNEGLARARGEFVQFVDGDTRLARGWVAHALGALASDASLAGVEGALVELRPEANVYHSVCELDWPAGEGEVDFVGGNSLYRRAAIARAGGFDERLRVGEEPELGFRMRRAGQRFRRLDHPMAHHDLGLRGLRDYATRGRKSGLACGLVARATGGLRAGYWSARLRTTLLHAAWLTAPLALGLLALARGDARGGLAIAAVLALLGVLAVRKAARIRGARGIGWPRALAYGLHSYLFKLPSAVGVLQALAADLPPRTARSIDREDPSSCRDDVSAISIVIPAHDEEARIAEGLETLLEGAREGELDVVVVANGCRDATADRAREVGALHPGALRVIELERASKHAALVRGDAEARSFPRFYVDADVSLSVASLRRVADVLRRGEALVAAPRMRVDLGHSSWAVRAYYRVWMRLPYHASGTIGSGVYALSERGRERVGAFPDIISDDGYVRLCFAPSERASVREATFTIRAPRTLAGVLAVKTRSQKGWRQLRERFPELVANDGSDYGGSLRPLLADLRIWPALAVYGFVAAITKYRAWRLNRAGRLADWERDDSSRSHSSPGSVGSPLADDAIGRGRVERR